MDAIERKNQTVLLIMGSTRAGRVCPTITAWVAQIGGECTALRYEVVDLADWPLPMDDESAIPALGPYAQPHTIAWSQKIQEAAAVVFVTPQFNWGYPAVLKNAIDHLYHEWRGKPVAFVTYGGHGGTRCAKQLRQVAVALHMNAVIAAPALYLSEAVIRHGAALEPARDFERQRAAVARALQELEIQVNGQESVLRRGLRKVKSVYLALA